MKNASILRYLSVLLLILAVSASAQIPTTINYQGLLMTDDGNYPDTSVFITFTIYDAPAEGTALWSETQTNVIVEEGLFEVRLGASSPLSISVFSGTERWLGITVGTDAELFPRIKLVSVPYSFKVSTIDGASGGVIQGELTVVEKLTVGEGATNDSKGGVVIGEGNYADADYCSILGGQYNASTAPFGTIIGGAGNQVSAQYGFVGGGLSNIAEGFGSFVAGGNANYATGLYSFAAGNQARALHDGSMVLSANDCPT